MVCTHKRTFMRAVSISLFLIQTCDLFEQIPPAEMEAAREAWSKGPQLTPQPRKREHPMWVHCVQHTLLYPSEWRTPSHSVTPRGNNWYGTQTLKKCSTLVVHTQRYRHTQELWDGWANDWNSLVPGIQQMIYYIWKKILLADKSDNHVLYCH